MDDSLQWGHDFDVVEDLAHDASIKASRRKRSSLHRGHDFDVVEDTERAVHPDAMKASFWTFNGATTLTSWKTAAYARPHHPEPTPRGFWLQWGHDFDVVEDVETAGAASAGRRARCFNGATTLTSWKTPGSSGTMLAEQVEILQWGPRL